MKRLYIGLALLIAMSMLLASCATPTPETVIETVVVEKEGETVIETVEVEVEVEKEVVVEVTPTPAPVEQVAVMALDVGPGGYNNSMPYNFGAGHTMHIKMFTPLFVFNDTSTDVVPFIIEDYSSNDDFTVWTFKLREDVVFSDGEPLTTEDFKFTAEFMTSPDLNVNNVQHRNTCFGNLIGFDEKVAGEAEELEGFEVIDDYTFEWTLSSGQAFQYATMYGCYVLPAHAIDFTPAEYESTDWWYSDRQVGAGPFHVSDYVKDEYMELIPNEYYFKGRPKLDKIVERYFAEETPAVLALAAGEIDFTYISPDVIQTLPEGKFEIYGGSSYVTIFHQPMYKEIGDAWKDVRVRQAFLHAIDRQAIADEVLWGTHTVLPCAVPIQEFWPDGLNQYEYDPDKALALLEEAGVDPADLGPIDIITHPGYANPMMQDVIQAIISYLAEVGIEAEIRFLDLPTWRTTHVLEGYDLSFRGMGLPIYTRSYSVIESNAGRQGGDAIGYDFEADGFEAAIEAVYAATDYETYAQRMGELCALENEVLPNLYMFVGDRFGAASLSLKDFYWYPAPGGGPYDDHAELWYIGE
jgi:peptide/nickel transport system substrate-binding protein